MLVLSGVLAIVNPVNYRTSNYFIDYRSNSNAGGVLSSNINRSPDRNLLLLADCGVCVGILVFPAAKRRALSRSTGAASAVKPADGKLGIPGGFQ